MQGRDSLVFRFDGERLPAYLGFDAAPLHLWHLRADVDLRDSVDALLCKCAVVNPHAVPCPLQSLIGLHLPRFAPVLQKRLVVPTAVLLAESIRANVAHGEQDVGVRVLALGVVNGNVGHHAHIHELATGKAAH
nr:hypothetical protein [Vulcanococcus sp. Clear-D1]